MKKSKIIIPALGMLILSTAASVTGTVAWFTTVSSAKAELTTFAVRKLGGDLSYAVTPLTGTEKVNDAKADSSIRLKNSTAENTSVALCDASYDHVNNVLYKAANGSATSFASVGAESESNWKVEGTDAQSHTLITYYAVTWQYTFTYTFGGSSGNVNLYFDSINSSLDPTLSSAAAAGHTEQTYKGFRIAFINSAASRKVVWAGEQAAAKCLFVDSDTTVAYDAETHAATYTNNGTYGTANSSSSATDLLDSTGLAIIDENAASGAANRSDYLGVFTPAANTITVKCVAWFEGTDENVVNGSEMDQVDAVLNFYTRTAA